MTNIEEEAKEIKKFQEDSKKEFGKVLDELAKLQDALKNISCMQSNKPPKKGTTVCTITTRRKYSFDHISSIVCSLPLGFFRRSEMLVMYS